MRFAPADVAVDGVLAELETLVAPRLPEKRLRHAYHTCNVAPTAHVDAERLEQILLDLVPHAVNFTPDGGEVAVHGWLDEGSTFALTLPRRA